VAEQSIATASPLVKALVARNREPQWLQSFREDAWQAYEKFPSPKLEKTDLRNRTWDVTALSSEAVGKPRTEVAQFLEAAKDEPFLCLRDGAVVAVHVPADLAEQGVILTDLNTAVQQHEELVRKHLGTVVAAEADKWSALNGALWENGIFVYVPRNVQVQRPIQFVYEESPAGKGGRPRCLVVAEEGSRLAFAEISFVPEEGATGGIHSAVTEIVAQPLAHVDACALTNFRKGPTNFVTRRAKILNDARVDWVVGDIGDGFTVGLVESLLEGSASQSHTRVLGFGYGRQRLELTASMEHRGRSSESDIVMHGVVRGRANSVYRSSTHIQRGAADAASEQHDRMLLLNEKTRADAIPMLLIDENNVRRCGHAASVGKIDEVQVYYLMSRGISKKQATKMIVWSYLAPTVDAIVVPAFREFVAARINKELEQ